MYAQEHSSRSMMHALVSAEKDAITNNTQRARGQANQLTYFGYFCTIHQCYTKVVFFCVCLLDWWVGGTTY